jgi:hypothetical protein
VHAATTHAIRRNGEVAWCVEPIVPRNHGFETRIV